MRVQPGLLPLRSQLQQVVPLYQPIIDLHTQRVGTFEALARCTHPHWSTVSPEAFIPIARDAGVLDALTLTLCEQVAQDLEQLGSVSINLELAQLANPWLVERIVEIFEARHQSIADIQIEITEVGVMAIDYGLACKGIERLKHLGAQLSLDDFGNGLSNFERLCELPVDTLKIPRNLVTGMTGDKGLACVIAILGIASSLGLRTIAEGVENNAQVTALKQMGCSMAQGFWYSRPLGIEQAERFRRKYSS